MSEGTFNSFSTIKQTFGPLDFFESNSLVAKIAFLLLIIFGFVILLRIGISTLSYFFKPSDTPHLIDGMVDATQMITFQQDPSSNGSTTIYRSVNENDGIEFSWSVWLFINSLDTSNTARTYKHVFSKGNSNLDQNGLIFPNNAPGLYIAPNTNALVVIMNTFNVINEEVEIPDIPLNKWINVIIRCQNTTLDVYINGTIARSINLVGVPKQNYGDVYVAMNGGFNGYISNLWYYNYALGTAEIQEIAAYGPNTKMIGTSTSAMTNNLFNYLSLRWFLYGDTYNPTASGGASVTPASTPVAVPRPPPVASTPVAVSRPAPVPASTPVAIPRPAPVPVAVSRPAPVPAPVPVAVPRPASTPVAVPRPAPVAVPRPAPVAVPRPAPLPAPVRAASASLKSFPAPVTK